MPRCYMVKKALCNKYASDVAREFESWGRGRRKSVSPITVEEPVSPTERTVAPPVSRENHRTHPQNSTFKKKRDYHTRRKKSYDPDYETNVPITITYSSRKTRSVGTRRAESPRAPTNVTASRKEPVRAVMNFVVPRKESRTVPNIIAPRKESTRTVPNIIAPRTESRSATSVATPKTESSTSATRIESVRALTSVALPRIESARTVTSDVLPRIESSVRTVTSDDLPRIEESVRTEPAYTSESTRDESVYAATSEDDAPKAEAGRSATTTTVPRIESAYSVTSDASKPEASRSVTATTVPRIEAVYTVTSVAAPKTESSPRTATNIEWTESPRIATAVAASKTESVIATPTSFVAPWTTEPPRLATSVAIPWTEPGRIAIPSWTEPRSVTSDGEPTRKEHSRVSSVITFTGTPEKEENAETFAAPSSPPSRAIVQGRGISPPASSPPRVKATAACQADDGKGRHASEGKTGSNAVISYASSKPKDRSAAETAAAHDLLELSRSLPPLPPPSVAIGPQSVTESPDMDIEELTVYESEQPIYQVNAIDLVGSAVVCQQQPTTSVIYEPATAIVEQTGNVYIPLSPVQEILLAYGPSSIPCSTIVTQQPPQKQPQQQQSHRTVDAAAPLTPPISECSSDIENNNPNPQPCLKDKMVQTVPEPPEPKPASYTYDTLLVADGRSRHKKVTPNQKSQATEPEAPETSKSGRYVCCECGKQYATSSNLSRHKQTHRSIDSQSAKKCIHCGKAYVSMPALAMHVLTHKLAHSCGVCGKMFSRPWLLQGHLRSHTGEKPYGCAHCGKAFADRSNLRAHMQTHSADKNYECSRCHKTFALKSYLNKHLESACLRDDEMPAGNVAQQPSSNDRGL